MKPIDNFIFWMIVALFGLGLFFLCRCDASHSEALEYLRYQAPLNYDQREYFIRQVDHHERMGQHYYKKAEDSCMFLPALPDRDKARYCFTSAMAMAAPGTPMSKIISAILVALTQYGLDCLEQTEITENWLLKAEYHFEMKEFFEGVLVNG